jgi:two-component system OmpR family sensor kinase
VILQKCKASFLLNEAKKAVLEDANIEVRFVDDFDVECSIDECITAIKNLLENGIKHSVDNRCSVVVGDKFIEISNSIKEPLYRLDILNKPFIKDDTSGGFGLGLFLVQSIADRNRIRLELLQKDNVAKFKMIFV